MISSIQDGIGMTTNLRFHPDGTCLAGASADHLIRIWDVRS